MGEWDAYATLAAPAAGDTLLIRDISATPPAPGTVQQVTTASLLGMTLWPSGDLTGVADAAALNTAVTAMGTSSGTIFLMPGQWYWKPGAVSAIQLANSQTLVIDGRQGAVINAVAGTAGDMLRMYNPNSQPQGSPGNIFSLRSGVRGLTIDGTNATAGSSASKIAPNPTRHESG